MSVETASYIHQLDPANPSGTDRLAQGDDHLRMLKRVLRETFPNITGPVTLTHTALNALAASLVPFGVITAFYGLTSAIPLGWAKCDGSTVSKADGSGTVVTPDLFGRVVVGAGTDTDVKLTFGSPSVTVTTASIPSFTPVVTLAAAGAHAHGDNTGSTVLTTGQLPAHQHFTVATGPTGSYGSLGPTNYVAAVTDNGNTGSAYLAGIATVANAGLTSSIGSGSGHTHTITAEAAHTHGVTVTPVDGHAHSVTVPTVQPSMSLFYIMKI